MKTILRNQFLNSAKILCIFAVAFVFYQCKTGIGGTASPNAPPQTHTVVDSILRSGPNRLSTQIAISWWATDADGYIKGYEFTFDNPAAPAAVWRYTTRTDSIFLINLPVGSDTADVQFAVRAIDNDLQKDPTPARLIYPLKNTPPTIAFKYTKAGGNPLAGGSQLRSFAILRYNWQAADADGAANISGYQLVLNDTAATPYFLDKIYTGATFVATTPTATNSPCVVYAGNSTVAQPNNLQGLLLSDTNILYIRAVDLSGAKSGYIAAKKVYIKRQTSTTLIVNAYPSNAQIIDQFYNTQLPAIGINNFEIIQLLQKNPQNDYTQLPPDYATQSRIFSLFDNIIWCSDDLNFTVVYAQSTLGGFLNKGGNLFITCRPGGEDLIKSPFYEFTPIDSLQQPPAGKLFLMTDTSTIRPIAAGYPILLNDGFLTVPRPVKLLSGSVPLLKANIILRDGAVFTNYTGNTTVMGMRTNALTGSKIVFSTLQMHKTNANGNIGILLDKILKQEFGVN